MALEVPIAEQTASLHSLERVHTLRDFGPPESSDDRVEVRVDELRGAGGADLEAARARQHEEAGARTLRARMRSVAYSLAFQAFMILVTLADVASFLVLASGPASLAPAADAVGVAAICLYLLELVLKLVGCGPHVWARDPWNWSDLLILVASAALLNSPGKVVVVARLLRVLKNCRVAKSLARAVKVARLGVQASVRGKALSPAVRHKVSGGKLRFVGRAIDERCRG